MTGNRPWDRDQVRLGLQILSSAPGGLDNPVGTGISWWLYRAQSTGDRGEVAIDEPPPPASDKILTAAEFAALRRDCGLSQAECCDFFSVAQKTMSHWENVMGAPEGHEERVAELLGLRVKLQTAAETAVTVARDKLGSTPNAPVDLFAYHQNDYKNSQPAREGLPHGAHWKLLTLSAEALTDAGFNVSILYAPRDG